MAPQPGTAQARSRLRSMPPLVFAGEVDALRDRLAHVAQGKAFLLQGGDCAETFADATADKIKARVKTILQMAIVLTYGASLPVVKIRKRICARQRLINRRDAFYFQRYYRFLYCWR